MTTLASRLKEKNASAPTEDTERYVQTALHLGTHKDYAAIANDLKIPEMLVREIAADAHVYAEYHVRIRGGKPISANDMSKIHDVVSDSDVRSNINTAASKLQTSYFFAYASHLISADILNPLAIKAGVSIDTLPALYPAAAAWMERYQNEPIPKRVKKPVPKASSTPPDVSAHLSALPIASEDFIYCRVEKHDRSIDPSAYDARILEVIPFPKFDLVLYDLEKAPGLIVFRNRHIPISLYGFKLLKLLRKEKNWGRIVTRAAVSRVIGGPLKKLSTESHLLRVYFEANNLGQLAISPLGVGMGDGPIDETLDVQTSPGIKPIETLDHPSFQLHLYDRKILPCVLSAGSKSIHLPKKFSSLIKTLCAPENIGTWVSNKKIIDATGFHPTDVSDLKTSLLEALTKVLPKKSEAIFSFSTMGMCMSVPGKPIPPAPKAIQPHSKRLVKASLQSSVSSHFLVVSEPLKHAETLGVTFTDDARLVFDAAAKALDFREFRVLTRRYIRPKNQQETFKRIASDLFMTQDIAAHYAQSGHTKLLKELKTNGRREAHDWVAQWQIPAPGGM